MNYTAPSVDDFSFKVKTIIESVFKNTIVEVASNHARDNEILIYINDQSSRSTVIPINTALFHDNFGNFDLVLLTVKDVCRKYFDYRLKAEITGCSELMSKPTRFSDMAEEEITKLYRSDEQAKSKLSQFKAIYEAVKKCDSRPCKLFLARYNTPILSLITQAKSRDDKLINDATDSAIAAGRKALNEKDKPTFSDDAALEVIIMMGERNEKSNT